jgi:hypothetical protein
MRKRLLSLLFLVAIIGLAWTSSLNDAFSVPLSPETGNYENSYTFAVQNGYYQSDYTLYLSLTPSLRDYYQAKVHTINSYNDYARFVTPNAVQSIADHLRNITQNMPYDDEAFANAVLMGVRQISYVRSNAKYPVETLIDNSADCDGLSILAASIMKAGGLDVVLLLYQGVSPTHMNVGVYLEHMPVSHLWWKMPSGINYGNKTYWVAECTSLAEWTVGDRPELLSRDDPLVIPLENCETTSPASVSSNLNDRLQNSSISLNLSPDFLDINDKERELNISGSIFPAYPNETVALYVNQPGYPPKAYTTITDQFGNYSIKWNGTYSGNYQVLTSWSGVSNYSGSDSETVTVFIGTQQLPIDEMLDFWSGQVGLQSTTYSPNYVTLINKGNREFLKSNLTGMNVELSGEFLVLGNENYTLPNSTTITIPAHEEIVHMLRSRRTMIVQVPERTVEIPGIELFYDQFGFILKHDGDGNYTGSVKLLTDTDMSQIRQDLDENNALFVNASAVATKNMWYRAVAKVLDGEVSIELYDENGTRLENMTAGITNMSFGEVGIIMTYGVGQVVAFKNLKVEAITRDNAPVGNDKAQEGGIELYYPYVRMSLLIAGTALAIVCLKERRDSDKRLDKPTTSDN